MPEVLGGFSFKSRGMAHVRVTELVAIKTDIINVMNFIQCSICMNSDEEYKDQKIRWEWIKFYTNDALFSAGLMADLLRH